MQQTAKEHQSKKKTIKPPLALPHLPSIVIINQVLSQQRK
jgi:hypothetical protein